MIGDASTYYGINPSDARGSCQQNDMNAVCEVTSDIEQQLKAASNKGYTTVTIDISSQSLFGSNP